MVAHSRAPVRFDQLRPLNRPAPVQIVPNERGEPLWVRQRGRRRQVVRVIDRWRLDDEWWREPLHRLYYLVEMAEGSIELFFHDLVEDRWYRQRDVR